MVGVHHKNNKTTSPSKYLDIALITSNRTFLKDAAGSYMSKRKPMKDDGGPNGTMKLVAINMYQMGCIKPQSGIMNSPKMLAKMTNQMKISSLLAKIRTIEATYNVNKRKIYTDSMILLNPSTKIKLVSKSDDVMKITKKEMCLLLLVSHNASIEYNKYNKQHMASMLSEKIR